MLNSSDTNLDPGRGSVPPIKEFKVIVSNPEAKTETGSIFNPLIFTLEVTFKSPCRFEVSRRNEYTAIEIPELYEFAPKTSKRPELTLGSYKDLDCGPMFYELDL